MKKLHISSDDLLGRDALEALALDRICVCQYYDLADCLDATSDAELIDFINHNYTCMMCGLRRNLEDDAS